MVIENSEEGGKKRLPPLSLQIDSPNSKGNNNPNKSNKREEIEDIPLNLDLNQEIEMSKILSPNKIPGHLRKSSFSPKKKSGSSHKPNGSHHNSPQKNYPQEENNAGSQILLNSNNPKKKSLKKKILNYLPFKKMNKSR